jgi:hypothetical protein
MIVMDGGELRVGEFATLGGLKCCTNNESLCPNHTLVVCVCVCVREAGGITTGERAQRWEAVGSPSIFHESFGAAMTQEVLASSDQYRVFVMGEFIHVTWSIQAVGGESVTKVCVVLD